MSEHCEGCDGVVPDWGEKNGQPSVTGSHACAGCGHEAELAALRTNHTKEGTVTCTCDSFPHTPNCGLDERLTALRAALVVAEGALEDIRGEADSDKPGRDPEAQLTYIVNRAEDAQREVKARRV